MEIYKNWEIGKNDFGYYEAINLNDCDSKIQMNKDLKSLKDDLDEIEYEKNKMEITQIEYRKNVLSNCCSCFVIENTNRCTGCNENCEFILEELTAFHKWILATARKQIKGDEEITYQDEVFKIMSLIRLEIIKKQNPQAFELLEMVDIGETQFNKATLQRAADILINTDLITQQPILTK